MKQANPGPRREESTSMPFGQRENIPIVVFDINHPDNIEKIIRGEEIGTLVV